MPRGCVSEVFLACGVQKVSQAVPVAAGRLVPDMGYEGSSFQAPETPSRQRKGWDAHELGKWPTGGQSVCFQSGGRPAGCPARRAQPLPVPAVARQQRLGPLGTGREAASPHLGKAGCGSCPGPQRRPRYRAGCPRRIRSQRGASASHPGFGLWAVFPQQPCRRRSGRGTSAEDLEGHVS